MKHSPRQIRMKSGQYVLKIINQKVLVIFWGDLIAYIPLKLSSNWQIHRVTLEHSEGSRDWKKIFYFRLHFPKYKHSFWSFSVLCLEISEN